MSLRRSLRGDTEFSISLSNIRARAEKIWAAGHHVFFTGHDVAHSERVIDKLDGLCSRAKLNAVEAYVLLAAAYLHDIGMQWHETALQPQEIRERHHLLGADWVIASARPSARPDADPPPLGVIPDYAEYIALLVL